MPLTRESPRDSLGFIIADVARLGRRAFAQVMAKSASNLTNAQARALVRVAWVEGLRQVELANELEVEPITVARLIDQLAARGLVERRADPQDRRAYRLFVTPAAEPYLAAIFAAGELIRVTACRGLSAAQVVALRRMLGRIRDNLNEFDAESKSPAAR